MKNELLVLLLLFTFFVSHAQSDDLDSPKTTTIFFEAYKPVLTNSIKYFDESTIIFQDHENNSRELNFYAVGAGLEFLLENGMIARPRIGLSVIDLSNYSDQIQSNIFEESMIESAFVYEQSYVNLFFGLMKRFQLDDQFSIDMGADLAFISYLEGRDELYTNAIHRGDFTSTTRVQEWYVTNYGKATSFGIGPIIKPEFRFKMGLSFSFEIQYYFMKTTSDTNITEDYRQSYIVSQSGMDEAEEFEQSSEIDIDFSEWSWSELAPLIRIGYSF